MIRHRDSPISNGIGREFLPFGRMRARGRRLNLRNTGPASPAWSSYLLIVLPSVPGESDMTVILMGLLSGGAATVAIRAQLATKLMLLDFTVFHLHWVNKHFALMKQIQYSIPLLYLSSTKKYFVIKVIIFQYKMPRKPGSGARRVTITQPSGTARTPLDSFFPFHLVPRTDDLDHRSRHNIHAHIRWRGIVHDSLVHAHSP